MEDFLAKKNLFIPRPLWLVPFAVLGMVFVYGFATETGSWISPDSEVYLEAASNLWDGHGIYVTKPGDQPGVLSPMTHFPPLFPILLAPSRLVGLSPAEFARIFNTAMFGLTIFFTGWIVLQITRSLSLSLIGSFLMSTSTILIVNHAYVWTEPLFFILALTGFFSLAKFIDGSSPAFLLISALLAALAVLDRYAAAAMIATGGLAILLLEARTPWRRVLDAAVFGTVSSIPILVWVIRNMAISETAVNREFSYHPIPFENYRTAVAYVTYWFIPDSLINLSGGIRLGILLAAFAAVTFLILWKRGAVIDAVKQAHKNGETTLPSILCLFFLTYLLLIFVNCTFFDTTTPLDGRILSPLFPCGLILILFGWNLISTALAGSRTLARTAGIVLAVYFALCYSYDSFDFLSSRRLSYGQKTELRNEENPGAIMPLPSAPPMRRTGEGGL